MKKSIIKLDVSDYYKFGYGDELPLLSSHSWESAKEEIQSIVDNLYNSSGIIPNLGDVFTASESNIFLYVRHKRFVTFDENKTIHVMFTLDDWDEDS